MERNEFIQWLKLKTNCIIVNDLDRKISENNINRHLNNSKNNDNNTKDDK